MRLTDVLDEGSIELSNRLSTKEEVLHKLVSLATPKTGAKLEVLKRLLEREALGSTGIGEGVAVPHAVIEGLTKPKAILAILPQPVDFDATDDLPVDILFLLLTPRHCMSENFRILQSFCTIARDPSVLIGLRRARSASDVIDILSDFEKPAERDCCQ